MSVDLKVTDNPAKREAQKITEPPKRGKFPSHTITDIREEILPNSIVVARL